MINLGISFGAALAVGLLCGIVADSVIAGVLPFLLVLVVAYVLLARRSATQLEAVMRTAQAQFEAQNIDGGKATLKAGFKLAPWQFLVAQQLHAQLGIIEFMLALGQHPDKRDWSTARKHLELAWSRIWMAQAALSVIDFREKKMDEALARMERSKGAGDSDPLFWALYAKMAVGAEKAEVALVALAEGVKKNPSSEPLKALDTALRNKKKPKWESFAPGWYQFFPEDMPREQLEKMAREHMGRQAPRGQYGYPAPRR
jgi:predicted Zn-dependent protease